MFVNLFELIEDMIESSSVDLLPLWKDDKFGVCHDEVVALQSDMSLRKGLNSLVTTREVQGGPRAHTISDMSAEFFV
jgi:hypothetical protein